VRVRLNLTYKEKATGIVQESSVDVDDVDEYLAERERNRFVEKRRQDLASLNDDLEPSRRLPDDERADIPASADPREVWDWALVHGSGSRKSAKARLEWLANQSAPWAAVAAKLLRANFTEGLPRRTRIVVLTSPADAAGSSI
jgi:hypothetical protein